MRGIPIKWKRSKGRRGELGGGMPLLSGEKGWRECCESQVGSDPVSTSLLTICIRENGANPFGGGLR